MKIIMLSWEYPPKSVGGLSTHVYNLSQGLNSLGHEVHVITCEEGTAPIEENDKGVNVHRIEPYKIDTEDFVKWVMQLNFAMIEEGIRLIKKLGEVNIIHAHDWLTTYAAKVLKWSFNIPMVCTIHATEYGRNGGIQTDMQRYISSSEWMLTYEAWKVITCSSYMRKQISDIFSTPFDKIRVIPNGVDSITFDLEFDEPAFRREFANDDEKIVFFIGRHVYEKGIHLLIEAASKIVAENKKTRFIIGGKGPMTEELKSRVKQLGLENNISFVGYMDDATRNKMYKVADAAVFPSLYEPFGIVALEAMSAGCPVVVSDTGGFSEIIEHKVNGLKVITGWTPSIEDNVCEILKNEELAKELKENGQHYTFEQYAWDIIAQSTISLYEEVKKEAQGTEWQTTKIREKSAPRKKKTTNADDNVEEKPKKTVKKKEKVIKQE